MIADNTTLKITGVVCSIWFVVAIVAYSIGGLSTLSGEEMGWGILVAPIALIFAVFIAGTPAVLFAVGSVFRNKILAGGFIIAALVFQFWAWPSPPDCGFRTGGCEDPFTSYKIIVILCWCGAVAVGTLLITQSLDDDPDELPPLHYNAEWRGERLDEDASVAEEEHAGPPPAARNQANPKKQYWEHYEDE